ncbi:5'-nucleotidase, lipoprotein e(P4) family [Maribellus luteus]|uniref:5'-nucleotidase, lipoprotein e(P4) family n=1 Tax=Maribellus luteus TaxID=2305463 RepID=A0A399T9E4_9BACT|nr:5'-nucleotidase, lipoprotein e(P4) family [Maribellus luteus]RIJ50837.1 5'-nucleotidase, lipoprotein e(P4) family [Maribellus luteus]
MKISIINIFIIIFLLGCVACKHQAQPLSELQLQPTGQAWGALYQQQAAEYKALCYQAYNIARLRLDEKLQNDSGRQLVIVTDIDETVLDNSPYFINLAREGKVYSDSTWVEWTAEIKCDTIPGASHFLKYADKKGVTIYYISNRLEVELLPTIKNLEKWGFPYADKEHVFLMNLKDNSKESRRLSIGEDCEVVLYLGDKMGDFSSYFDHLDRTEMTERTKNRASSFGDKFIVLPNNMYGDWDDVLSKN